MSLLSSLGNKVAAVSVGFAVSSVTKKMNEAVSKVSTVFGGTSGPLTKLGANTPTIAAINAVNKVGGATEPTGTASTVKAITGETKAANNYKVILADGGDIVDFDVMPEIVESHTVEYEAVAPAQSPGAFQKYKGTSSTTWVLNVTLISRTPQEATDNLNRLNRLRGWKMPFFGEKTGSFYQGKLGAPPPVLRLSGLRSLVGPVPVVITSLNWNWPKDVDYITTSGAAATPFPAVMQIAINLVESFSAAEFNGFSLQDYRKGLMTQAFSAPPSSSVDGTAPVPGGIGRTGDKVSSEAISGTPSLRSGMSQFTDSAGKRLTSIGNTIASVPTMAFSAASDFGQSLGQGLKSLPGDFTVGSYTGAVRDPLGNISEPLTKEVAGGTVLVPTNAYVDDSNGTPKKASNVMTADQYRLTTLELNAVKQALVAISQRIADLQSKNPIDYISLALAQKQIRDLTERHAVLETQLQAEVL